MKIRLFVFLLFLGTGIAFTQQNNDTNLEVSTKACDCIAAINEKDLPKNKAIQHCIEETITDFSKKNKKDLPYTYTDIEKFLVKNCTALKKLVFSDDEKHEFSTSKNVLAQLAYDDGMDYFNEKDYNNAILKFQKAVKLDPKFTFAWDNLGISFRKVKQYDQAINAYQKSLQINSEGKMPLLNLAITYSLTKNMTNSVKYYQKYIRLYRDDPEGYYGLGLVQYAAEDYEQGLSNLIKAFKLYSAQQSPYRSDAASKISYMYNDLKKKDKLDIFNKVAEQYNLKVQMN